MSYLHSSRFCEPELNGHESWSRRGGSGAGLVGKGPNRVVVKVKVELLGTIKVLVTGDSVGCVPNNKIWELINNRQNDFIY